MQNTSDNAAGSKTDKETTVADLQRLVADFCEERNWGQYHGPKDLAIGLITEASELLEHFRFRNETESYEYLKEKHNFNEICDELSDCLFFILRFSKRFDVDLTQSLKSKMVKNALKYPAPGTR